MLDPVLVAPDVPNRLVLESNGRVCANRLVPKPDGVAFQAERAGVPKEVGALTDVAPMPFEPLFAVLAFANKDSDCSWGASDGTLDEVAGLATECEEIDGVLFLTGSFLAVLPGSDEVVGATNGLSSDSGLLWFAFVRLEAIVGVRIARM